MKIPENVNEWFSIFCLGKLPTKQLSLRDYFLFPLPFILIYFSISLFPNFIWVLHEESTPWFREAICLSNINNFYLKHCFLKYNIIWFILTMYALYTSLLFKNRFFLLLDEFKCKNIIDDDVYKEAKNSVINKKRFFFFLGLFEILFYVWWEPNDLAGIFIAVFVLPIGAQIFSTFTAGTFLSIILSKRIIRINVFDVDKRGGLKPISELLIMLASIYFSGILISYILYPTFYTMPKVFPVSGFIFIMIGVFIFFMPQVYIHRLLVKEKTNLLYYIQDKITRGIKEVIGIEHNKLEPQIKDEFQNHLSSFQNIRSEIDRMGTWPFDLNIIKFLISFSVPIIVFVVNTTNLNKPLSFDDIIDLITHMTSAPK
jgi:hypothetical protein